MDLSSFIRPENVFVGLALTTKKQVLQELADRSAQLLGLESRKIFEGLLERERLGSTGVGNGIAIPHAKLDALDDVFCLFLKLDRPIDFDAVDDEPVDLIWLMLAPTSAGADHLKMLQRVSRLLRDEKTREKIRTQSDALSVHSLLIVPPLEHRPATKSHTAHS